MRNCICFNFPCNNYNNEKYKNNNDTVIIISIGNHMISSAIWNK